MIANIRIVSNLVIFLFGFIFFGCGNASTNESQQKVETSKETKQDKVETQSPSSNDLVTVSKINQDHILTDTGEKIPLPGIDDPNVIRVVVVRHAEKETGEDPQLSEIGKERAVLLSGMLKDFNIAKVYATKYKRAMFTGIPMASAIKRSIKIYDTSKLQDFVSQDLKTSFGENLLVVGHSNTVPKILDLLEGEISNKDLGEKEYDKIFIVSVLKTGEAKTLKCRMKMD